MNIFIVDDNYHFRDAMKIYLNYVLHHTIVGEAENGLEFLKNYKFKNDIVLMDLKMPILNGYSAIKEAIEKDRRIKAIAMTTNSDNTTLKKLIETGFRGGFNKTEVLKKITKVLNKVKNDDMCFSENIVIS